LDSPPPLRRPEIPPPLGRPMRLLERIEVVALEGIRELGRTVTLACRFSATGKLGRSFASLGDEEPDGLEV